MIVKIERFDEKEKFIMIDNIESITKSVIDQDAGIEPVRVGDYIIKDCEAEKNPIRLYCVKNDGTELVIIFDTLVYVLNDQGKTIEKIAAF